MAGLWSIIAPEASTNFVLNPSAEMAGNFTTHAGSTVTRNSSYARYGVYHYLVIGASGVGRGINLTLSALANAIHHVTFYIHGDATPHITGVLQVSLDSGTTYNAAAQVSGQQGLRWERYQVSIPAAQANGSTALIIRNTVAENWRVDAIQVEATSGYYTTYIDGDRAGGFLGAYRWNGLRHGSTSTRSAQERNGGRERNFDDYSVFIATSGGGSDEIQPDGIGVMPLSLNYQELALTPGAEYAGLDISTRAIDFKLHLQGTSLANMHSLRKAFTDLISPFGRRDEQAFTVGYDGALSTKRAYLKLRYRSGLESLNEDGTASEPIVRCVADNPFWFEDDQQQASLDYQDSLASNNRVAARINGAWQNLGAGFNGTVLELASDTERNRVFFGGSFTTANAVAVNGIAYWNGTTFVAMGGATKGVSGGDVLAIAVAANGDVWVGGTFTSAGGSATDGIARWNIATDTWTVFALVGTAAFYALAINKNGILYGGGSFTNWNGDANIDYIVQYNGSTWSALGTGMGTDVNALAMDLDGTTLYAGGAFQTAGGVSASYVAKWSGTAWSALGSGANNPIHALTVGPEGLLYAGGNDLTALGGNTVSGIGAWNGSSWLALGSGVSSDDDVVGIAVSQRGVVYASGGFTVAGGVSVADRIAGWNGTSWFALDANLPGSPIIYGMALLGDDLYIGYDTTGTVTASGRTTVSNAGTAKAYPIVTLINANSSGTCTLRWLENQSTDQVMYFNFVVQAGETITIDLRKGRKRITSTFRGVVSDQPLSNSDFANWHLLPGSNTVAAYIVGTITSVSLLMSFASEHISVDGVAA